MAAPFAVARRVAGRTAGTAGQNSPETGSVPRQHGTALLPADWTALRAWEACARSRPRRPGRVCASRPTPSTHTATAPGATRLRAPGAICQKQSTTVGLRVSTRGQCAVLLLHLTHVRSQTRSRTWVVGIGKGGLRVFRRASGNGTVRFTRHRG